MDNKTGIYIESPYGELLNKVVTEMIDRDFTLQAIEKYVSQIEGFLNFMAGPDFRDADIRAYLKTVQSDSSLQALHFFFKSVLASIKQGSDLSDGLDNLYPKITV